MSSLAGRAEFLLREIYHGDQSRMAAETGVSQPQISLVVGGKRSPGERFIAGFTRIPRINVEWLRSGVGEPFVTKQPSVPAGGLSLPVYRNPPDLAGGDAGQRPGLHLQVEELFRPGMYLLEVQADDPVVRVPELKVAPGDLLVMETERTAWGRNPRSLVGKLTVIRLRGPDGAEHALARIELSPDTGRLAAHIFGTGIVSLAPSGSEPGAEGDAGSRCAGPIDSEWDPLEEPKKLASETAHATGAEGFATLPRRPFARAAPTMDDIVAVCVLTIRR